MNSQLLTLYVLFWPMVATIVLMVISVAVIKDMRAAKENGEELL